MLTCCLRVRAEKASTKVQCRPCSQPASLATSPRSDDTTVTFSDGRSMSSWTLRVRIGVKKQVFKMHLLDIWMADIFFCLQASAQYTRSCSSTFTRLNIYLPRLSFQRPHNLLKPSCLSKWSKPPLHSWRLRLRSSPGSFTNVVRDLCLL